MRVKTCLELVLKDNQLMTAFLMSYDIKQAEKEVKLQRMKWLKALNLETQRF